jgi:hypothetical protein
MKQTLNGRLVAALCLGSLLALGGCATEPGLDTAPAMAQQLVRENAEAQQLRPFLEEQGYVMQLAAAKDVMTEEQSLLGIPFTRGNEEAHLMFQRTPSGEVSMVVALVRTTSQEPSEAFTPFGVLNGRVEQLRVAPAACDRLCQAAGSYACIVWPGWWTMPYAALNDCIVRANQLCGCL